MIRWEYQSVKNYTYEELATICVEWGAGGWELVSVTRSEPRTAVYDAKYTAFFKRPS